MTVFDPETLIFKGTGPEECELFVSAIQRRALAEGKHRDDEWIAYFASSYFVGEALYWYDGLDEEVQSNWRDLRHAMLERFGQRSQTRGVSLRIQIPSSHTIPTPAAALPQIPFSRPYAIRRCRFQVIDLDGIHHGYIQLTSTPDGRLGQLCKIASQALKVSVYPSNEDILLQIHPSDQDETRPPPSIRDWLAVTWPGLTRSEWTETPHFLANFCSWSTTMSTTKWATERRVWTISNAGEIAVHYPRPDMKTERLIPYIDGDGCFLAWFRRSNPDIGRWNPVRVILEEAD